MPAPRPPRPAARPRSHPPRSFAPVPPAAPVGLTDEQRDALQHALDQLPAPLEPLDISALDGFLCGVALQPTRVPEAEWLRFVFDAEGRDLPPGLTVSAIRDLVLIRFRELNQLIENRQWFDPWVFELEPEDDEDDVDEVDVDEVEAVFPWVAGFATALTLFPGLSDLSEGPRAQPVIEALALVYRYLDPDDLEDAADLLAEIDTLEPAEDLPEAVEDLVQATLLLADVTRPKAKSAARPASKGPRSKGPRR